MASPPFDSRPEQVFDYPEYGFFLKTGQPQAQAQFPSRLRRQGRKPVPAHNIGLACLPYHLLEQDELAVLKARALPADDNNISIVFDTAAQGLLVIDMLTHGALHVDLKLVRWGAKPSRR
ncbi:hypothetical protein [Micavibrio aeruginosavorus]|uniref:Uncharacterized protein n=1 Tax=Micavibrio aeruginosavorus (strain ARL-13) TaxID=856793 RepID=G2KNB1_MICAA|nr:hypothetical protein [Micavibrio aeruginosavorus]AEP09444.1 hypothetical protein MICA_1116 [Micavibrio aeruginosavorus ARL-13]